MKRSLHVMAVTVAAVSALAFSAGESYSASTVVADDPDAKVEYSGQLSILTKFGLPGAFALFHQPRQGV